MSDFLVLGLIPGTPIQITFLLWIVGVTAAVISAVLWLNYQLHFARNWIIATFIARQVNRLEVAEVPVFSK